ncbi:hypothetical protein ACP4OV_012852 [Aristida adscensionis]
MGSQDGSGSSWGPVVVGVLCAVAAFTVASVAFGHLCVGRKAFQGNAERERGPCIDVAVVDSVVPAVKKEGDAEADGAETAAEVVEPSESEPPLEEDEQEGGAGVADWNP